MPPPLNTLFSNVLIVLGTVIENGLTIFSLLFKGLKLFLRRQMFSSLTLANVFQSDWSRWPCVTSNISVKKNERNVCILKLYQLVSIWFYLSYFCMYVHVRCMYPYVHICTCSCVCTCLCVNVYRPLETQLVFSFFSLYLLCKVFLWIWSSLNAPTLTS